MERVKISANFFLDEYIPKDLYLKYASKSWILLGLIDSRLIQADQMLRNVFGSVTINSWWNGGDRQWSGLRLPASPDYSLTSQHSYGRGSDKLFKHPASEVREYIKLYWKELGITCIEDNVSWIHSDVRALQNPNELLIVIP